MKIELEHRMRSKEVGTKARLKKSTVVRVHEHRCVPIEGVPTPSSADNAEVDRLRVSDLDGTKDRWIKPDDIDSLIA